MYQKLNAGLLNLPMLSAKPSLQLEKRLNLLSTLRGKHKEQRNEGKCLDFNFQYLSLQTTYSRVPVQLQITNVPKASKCWGLFRLLRLKAKLKFKLENIKHHQRI